MPEAFPCRYCRCQIRLITTERGRRVPVAAGAIEPHQRPLPEGKYFDEDGRFYTNLNAPGSKLVYRAHQELCTGANRMRRRSRT